MKLTVFTTASFVAITVCVGVATASGPIGVYALVDNVTLEPSSDKPERIRISGVFSAAVETPDNSTVYSAPQPGYLYFGHLYTCIIQLFGVDLEYGSRLQ